MAAPPTSMTPWEVAWRALDGLPAGGLNIAHEAVDRHAAGPHAQTVAIRWLRQSGARKDITYSELARETSRFANVLQELGVEPGERVFTLCGRTPELYVAALGALKHRAVFCPLFSAFGPEPILARLIAGDARVLVTTKRLYNKKIARIRASLPHLRFILLIDHDGPCNGVRSLPRLMARASEDYEIAHTDPETMALLHFTSGTTGHPKGAIHVHEAVVMHHATAELALDLRPGDIYWCTADPGWVTGTSYGFIAPLTHGVTVVVDEGEFHATRWFRTLQEQRVNVWYTAPTAIRMLMRLGTIAAHAWDLSALRFVASVGEPLNPEAVRWGERALGVPIHDTWWQTETGGIAIANLPGEPVRPGAMGRAVPGITAAIVRREEGGGVSVIDAPDVEGELALKAGWPSMFRGYLHNEDRYAACFVDGWYLTGDLARRDADGYFWFVGRADDVIKSAGHLIGPFEVESALMEHPAVAEVAVIGAPDEVAGSVVKAFVSVMPNVEVDQMLERELMAFARRRLGSAIAPRQIAFEAHLPHTRSGKIMRRLLKARELGLAPGDTSTLEVAP